MVGWIKLHRKIKGSQMYRALNSKQRDVMIHCLLTANHSENEWEFEGQVYKCKPGEFVTSLASIASECGSDVRVQSVRTALLKLEKWGFLTNKSTKTGRLISIRKWELYQDESNKDGNKQPTKLQQSSNKALTTNKNDKNDNNEKKKVNTLSSKEFYTKEGRENIDEKYIVQYREFVNLLFDGTIPSSGILKIDKQLDYKDFEKVLLKASSQGQRLSDLVAAMANSNKYTVGKKSLYLTLNSWLNRN